jgi:drug/metabolite transporter (DMT)-like permease
VESELAPSRLRVHGALVAVQLAFGLLPVTGKLVMASIPPMGVAWLRLSGAAIVFGLLARHRGVLAKIRMRDAISIAFAGALGMGLNQFLFLEGLHRTTPINASVLASTIPVFTVLVSVLARKEAFRPIAAAGIALALGGVLYLVGVEAFSLGIDTVVGDVLIVVNALAYAIYLVVIKEQASRYGSLATVAVGFAVSAVLATPFGLYSIGDSKPIDLEVGLLLAYVIVGATIFTYFANAWALKYTERSVVAIYIYLQPLVASISSALVLREYPSTRAYVAAACVFAGIAFVTWPSRGAMRAPDPIPRA